MEFDLGVGKLTEAPTQRRLRHCARPRPRPTHARARATQALTGVYLWAVLIARIYEVFPLLCPLCGG